MQFCDTADWKSALWGRFVLHALNRRLHRGLAGEDVGGDAAGSIVVLCGVAKTTDRFEGSGAYGAAFCIGSRVWVNIGMVSEIPGARGRDTCDAEFRDEDRQRGVCVLVLPWKSVSAGEFEYHLSAMETWDWPVGNLVAGDATVALLSFR